MLEISPETADLLVRWTARCFVALYLLRCWIDSGLPPFFKEPTRLRSLARFAWTAGALLFAIHISLALALVHDFSHAKAYQHTAERTAEVTGIDWGGGIYVNHAFLVYWWIDVALWWRKGKDFPYQSPGYYWAMQSIFAFMFINATVIFGPPHWIMITAILIAAIIMLKVLQKSK